MPRFYVEKDGEWNIFSTITDDFIFDEFVCLDALKARLLYERYKELTKDIDSLVTDRPRMNVMSYEEAVERIRETESQTKLFTDKDGDVWEWRDDAWHCISGDEPQTERSE